jgi:phosphoribosyl 1,2-cyclic phosphodiesterase
VIITYWGTRGSIPVPGPDTMRFGGNTACLSVEIDGRVLVIDAGTGIRPLGDALLASEQDIFLLLSHPHADHVIGFPFFAPLYRAGRRIFLLDHASGGDGWSLLELFDDRRFPRPVDLAAHVTRVRGDVVEFLREQGIRLARLPLNHPGGSYGYRIESEGRSFVHLTDNELHPPGTPPTPLAEVVRFCQGADVLSHDAQYLDDEVSRYGGRGHSSVAQVCDLAARSGVGHLVLFHHDPARTDAALLAVEAEARAMLAGAGIACTAAYEGLVLELGPAPGLPEPRVPAQGEGEGAALTRARDAADPAAAAHPAGPAG